MIHNRYMEMSNIPGQDRGPGPHTQPLKFAPCPAEYHMSLKLVVFAQATVSSGH